MKLIFTIIFNLLANSLFSQASIISGKIIDAQTNRPVEKAHIVVRKSTSVFSSDASGKFEFTHQLPTSIVISHINYEMVIVDLIADKPNILLKPMVYILDKLSINDSITYNSFNYNKTVYESEISKRSALAKNNSRIVELKYNFPGGIEEFHNYLTSSIIANKDTLKELHAKVAFTVKNDGKIGVDSITTVGNQGFEIVNQIFNECPRWIPAYQGTSPVSASLTQIIEYNINSEVFSLADVQPQYQGGITAFHELISANLNHPLGSARSEGRVFVTFAINQLGEIEILHTIKGEGIIEEYAQEAKRVVMLSSGKWTPAKKNGKPVKFRMSIPIVFK